MTTIKTNLWICAAVAFLSLGTLWMTEESVAAEAAPAAEASATAEGGKPAATKQQTTLIDYIKMGGPIMILILIASAIMLALIFDGIYNLRLVKMAPDKLFASLKQAMGSANYQEAWQIARANPCFLSNVFKKGIEKLGKGEDMVSLGLEEGMAHESSSIRAKSSYLSVIGVVSPMIGLTGTVFGMMGAFNTMGTSGMGDMKQLSADIGHVLVATAAGLLISIPAFVFYYIFRNMAAERLIVIQEKIHDLMEDVRYEELKGIKIGENFSPAPGGANVQSRMSRQIAPPPSGFQGTVACPTCGQGVTPGAPSCQSCGTVLQWG
ncbi:MAG: MotA/TolQ/ExbB proton channel family protein [Verrucomicrobiae bacterium]|nr:MotA/TolQ/ExbB proton channel family protein [Verrucomicrobiae bacterium]